MDDLDRLFRRLVHNIRNSYPEYLTRPFEVVELYQNLVPYRHNRRELEIETNQDYEVALCQLLAGERGYVSGEPPMREAMQRELGTPHPDAGVFRQFATARVQLAPDALLRYEQMTVGAPGGLPPRTSQAGSGATESVQHGGQPRGSQEQGTQQQPQAQRQGAQERPAQPAGAEQPQRMQPGAQAPGQASQGASSQGSASQGAASQGSASQSSQSPSSQHSLTGAQQPPRPAAPPQQQQPSSARPSSPGSGGPASQSQPQQRPSAPPQPSAGAPSVASGAATAQCRYCGGNLPAGRAIVFCAHCGQNLTVQRCPACQTELELGWKFCVTCGRGVK